MRSMRLVSLLAILLLLIAVYLTRPLWSALLDDQSKPIAQRVLPGKNSVSGLKVEQDAKKRWMASFDYFFTGEPRGATFNAELVRTDGSSRGMADDTVVAAIGRIEPGQHHVSTELRRPFRHERSTTVAVTVSLRNNYEALASTRVAQEIQWPDMSTWAMERDLASNGHEVILKRASVLIDSAEDFQLRQADELLKRLVSADPRFAPAYIELARVAMKTNWGPEGLHQAETLLDSALEIDRDNANAKILLGYVYAHQRRFQQAEALLSEAAASGSTNQWLWSNWAELLAMQGRIEPAIRKYEEGLARPRTDEANDRARLDAYGQLSRLLDARNDATAVEDVYRRRAEEFGPSSCGSAQYGRYVLQKHGDAASAISLSKDATSTRCLDTSAQDTLGLAHYVAWAEGNGDQRAESLNKARVYLPAGPKVLYLLAGSDRTVDTARKLVAAGEPIDQMDNGRANALAYALNRRDYPAARRLMRLGARTDTPIGMDAVPIALLPAISGDVDGVRLMQKSGVDYLSLRYRGITAVEMARQMGDRRMLEALDPKSRSF